MNIHEVRLGENLITVEIRNGGILYIVFGKVINIDVKTKEIAISTKEERRLFRAKKLYPLSNELETLKFIKHLVRVINNTSPIAAEDTLYEEADDAQLLGWFIVALLEGKLKKSFFDQICQAVKEKGLIKDKPPQFQELVDALYRTLK